MRSVDEFLEVARIRALSPDIGGRCGSDDIDRSDFDGTHVLGWMTDSPVACLRVRFARDFATLDRLVVRPDARQAPVVFEIVRFALRLAARKGYARAVGYMREEQVQVWTCLGARLVGEVVSGSSDGGRCAIMELDIEQAGPVLENVAFDPVTLTVNAVRLGRQESLPGPSR